MIRHLYAHGRLPRHALDQDALRCHRQAKIVRQPSHAGVFDARVRPELKGRHHRSRVDLHNLPIHPELTAFLDQHPRFFAQRLLTHDRLLFRPVEQGRRWQLVPAHTLRRDCHSFGICIRTFAKRDARLCLHRRRVSIRRRCERSAYLGQPGCTNHGCVTAAPRGRSPHRSNCSRLGQERKRLLFLLDKLKPRPLWFWLLPIQLVGLWWQRRCRRRKRLRIRRRCRSCNPQRSDGWSIHVRPRHRLPHRTSRCGCDRLLKLNHLCPAFAPTQPAKEAA